MAAVYLACNRGKRSVVLDLRTAADRARLAELVAASDVLVHNMRRDAAVRCGADPDTLLAVNPGLVHCAIVGFGADGPYADLPAYDDTVQAVAGIAGAQSWMHGEPTYAAARGRRQGRGDGGGVRDRRRVAQARARRCGHGARGADGRADGVVRAGGAPLGPRVRPAARRGALPARVVTQPASVPDRRRSPRRARLHRPRLVALLRHDRSTGAGRRPALRRRCTRAPSTSTSSTAWWPNTSPPTPLRCGSRASARRRSLPRPTTRSRTCSTTSTSLRSGLFEEVDHPTEGRLLQCVTPITVDGVRVGNDGPAPGLGADTDAVFDELSRPRGSDRPRR